MKTGILIIMLLLMPIVTLAGNIEPGTAPGSTMHTLEDIYNKLAILDAFAKTPDQVCVATTFLRLNEDGLIVEESGTKRFWDNGDGTVTDCSTNLIWLKDADCFGGQTWNDAMASASGLSSGECGLTDGSLVDDWRLAGHLELIGLGLPSIPPFENLTIDPYWSYSEGTAVVISENSSAFHGLPGSDSYNVWPVKGDLN